MYKDKKYILCVLIPALFACIGCGDNQSTVSIQDQEVASTDTIPSSVNESQDHTIIAATDDTIEFETEETAPVEEKDVVTTSYCDEEYAKVENQSFELNMRQFGEVAFNSYAPYQVDGNRDALFQIEQGNNVLAVLNDPTVVGDVQDFGHIDAVSFPDLNQDGYDDVVVIVTYYALGGPDAGTDWQQVRCFIGTKAGEFIEDDAFEEAVNHDLTDFTISGVRESAAKHIELLSQYAIKEAEMIPMPEDFDLYRTYQIDGKQTDDHMSDGNSLRILFGSGLGSFGDQLEIRPDNTFTYYIGIGSSWDGSLRMEDGHIFMDIDACNEEGGHEAETKEMFFGRIDDDVYLIFEQYDELIYWK